MDNDNPLLQKAADLYRGLRFTMKYRGVDILPAAAGNDLARDLLESGELPLQERKYSIYGPSQVGSFKFLMLHRAVPLMSELSRTDEIILNLKYAVRRAAGSVIQWYGLDTSSVIVEQAPLVIPSAHENEKRIQRAK